MRRLHVGLALALVGLMAGAAPGAEPSKRPNVLLVIGDDLCWRDCGCYGNAEVKTPNIDRLARQGMRFDACFTGTAMCSPTRQQLYTGVFPVRNGAYPNHSKVRPGTRSFVHHFRALGYRTGLIGKTHVGPRDSFPYEYLGDAKPGGAWDFKAIAEFVNRDKDQPYFLVVASHNPHGPFTEGPRELYDPEKLTITPYLVDTPQTRLELAHYYAEVTALDQQVGGCMEVVDKSGRADDTIFLFTSEQGSSFPYGGKWTCYENGLKTGLIIRWPAVVKAGSTNRAMVQYVDVVPTLLEAAGGDPRAIDTGLAGAPDGGHGFDGRSFLAVLKGEAESLRDYVFGAHTTRGIINGSPCYPIRSIRDERYKYIINPNWKTEFSCVATRDLERLGWTEVAKRDPKVAERVEFFVHRPAEELYDLDNDPYEQHNLAGQPELAEVQAKLRAELADWMRQQGDEGIATEMRAPDREQRGEKKPKTKGTKKRKAAG